MRSLSLLALLATAAATAQNPASANAGTAGSAAANPGQVHCKLYPGPTAGDALTALVSGDAARAEKLYAAQPPSPESYAGIVRAELEQGRLDEAAATSAKAVAAFPASAQAQVLPGDAALRAGKLREASSAYAAALKLDPCSPRAHFGIGRLATLSGRTASAEHELTLAQKLSPADPAIAAAKIELLAPRDRAAALTAFLATKPTLPPQELTRLNAEAGLLAQSGFCSSQDQEPVAATKLELSPIFVEGSYVRSWGLKPEINGKGMSILELDSSVSGIVLNPKDAARAGIHPIAAQPAPDAPYDAIADTVKIAGMVFHGCSVRVVPAAFLAQRNSLIGLNFFREHLIHLDYAERALTLRPLPAQPPAPGSDEGKGWSPMYVAGPTILVPTMVNKNGPYLFALDTGAEQTVMAPAVLTADLGSQNNRSAAIMGTTGAIVKVISKDGGAVVDRPDVFDESGKELPVLTPVKLPVLTFAGAQIPDKRVISFDLSGLSKQANIQVSGLIGFFALQEYVIDVDYRDGLARLVYDVNHRYANNTSFHSLK